jgi:hypothetical protein
MNDEERARADRLLNTERVSGVAGLGNPPQFGLAVIGVLCERFGFEVSVDSSSPYGGVRAVVLLPHELLTSMPDKKTPAPSAPAAAPVPAPAVPEPAPMVGMTSDGLPLRRRKRPMAIVPTSEHAPAAYPRSGAETAAIMGAFQRGTRSGRAAHPDDADQTSTLRGASSEGHEFS